MPEINNKKVSIINKSKVVLKKVTDYKWGKYILEFIAGIFIIPVAIRSGINYISGPGSDDGWLGFWGGYLGSCITIIFAYTNTKLQLEEQKKNELRNAILIKQIENKHLLILNNMKYITELNNWADTFQKVESSEIKNFIGNKEKMYLEGMYRDYEINWNLALALDVIGVRKIQIKVDGKLKDKGNVSVNWQGFLKNYKCINNLISQDKLTDEQQEKLLNEKNSACDHLKRITEYVQEINTTIAVNINMPLYDTEH